MFFSVAIFVVSGILYGGLKYGYEPYLDSKVSDMDAKIADAEKSITTGDKARLLKLNSQVANLKSLLVAKRSTKEVLDWLQNNTLSKIRYSRADINREVDGISLVGVAATMEDFTAQLRQFQQDPMVRQAAFSHLGPAKGAWEFDITLALNTTVAKQ
jgi:hypothetical protein